MNLSIIHGLSRKIQVFFQESGNRYCFCLRHGLSHTQGEVRLVSGTWRTWDHGAGIQGVVLV